MRAFVKLHKRLIGIGHPDHPQVLVSMDAGLHAANHDKAQAFAHDTGCAVALIAAHIPVAVDVFRDGDHVIPLGMCLQHTLFRSKGDISGAHRVHMKIAAQNLESVYDGK